MIFPAKYDGTCASCNKAIVARKHYITWSRKRRGVAYHVDCANPERDPNTYPTQPGNGNGNGNGNEPQEVKPTESLPEEHSEPQSEPPRQEHSNGNGSGDAANLLNLIQRIAGQSLDESAVREIIREELAQIPQPEPQFQGIEVKVGESEPVKIKGTVHKAFEDVLKLCARRKNVLLIGPAGCGKTHLAEQVAKACPRQDGEVGLRFEFASCSGGQSEGHLGGRLLPIGDNARFEYVISKFIDCYENGGLFLLDEIDGADSNVLLFINSALANGKAYVPNRVKDPVAYRHPDFVCIAAANTYGTGSNRLYVGRNQLDESTLDRFRIGQIEMDYDTDIEERLVLDVELRTEFQRIRTAVNDNKLRRVVSTRAMLDAQDMRKHWTVGRCVSALTCGWTADEKSKAGVN